MLMIVLPQQQQNPAINMDNSVKNEDWTPHWSQFHRRWSIMPSKFAIREGVPVLGINSGQDVAQEFGLMVFFSWTNVKGVFKRQSNFSRQRLYTILNNMIITGRSHSKACRVYQEGGNTAFEILGMRVPSGGGLECATVHIQTAEGEVVR